MTALGTIIGYGTLANRPAASIPGQLYFATDSNGGQWFRDTGSVWNVCEPTAPVFTGEVAGTDFKATGLTGAVAASRYVGATASGAPTTGTFALGDFIIDQTGKLWICTTAGSPGTWTAAAGGSSGATNPMTAVGDMIVGGAVGAETRLSIGTSGQALQVETGAPYLAAPAAPALTVAATGGTVGATIPPPAAPSVSVLSTGGTIAAGTYGIELTYVNSLGETTPGPATTVTTTGSTSELAITGPAPVDSDTGWYAYVTQAGGSTYTRQQAAGSPTAQGMNLTISAPPTSTGAAPPSSNTAWIPYSIEVTYVNAQGETTASSAASVTPTATTSTITVTAPAAAGSGNEAATGYYVYSSQPGGATYTRQQAAGSPTALGTNYVLTAAPTTTGAAPPSTNTAGSLVPAWTSAAAGAAATTSTLGTVEVDHAPASGNPVALTEAGTALPGGMLSSTAPAADGTAATGTSALAARADHVHPLTSSFTTEVAATDFKATGLTGATATSRYVGATASGAPTTGTFALGDYVVDQTGKLWICTTAGSPGTWTQVAGSGTTYTLPDATTSATGGVEIDVAPSSGHPVALTAAGLTPGTTTGAPTTGSWVVGELHVDSSHALYVCTVAGTPGTWVQITGGGTTAAATTSALGTVEIDVAATTPVALTAAGLTPATTAGAPTTGTYVTGALYVDSAYALYVCSAGGTPGTWHQVGGSGSSTLAGDSDVAISTPTSGQVLTYNGTKWANAAASGGGSIYPVTAPPAFANWTWVNQGTATGSDVANGVGITSPVEAAGQLRGLGVALKAAPYTITAGVTVTISGVPYAGGGIFLRDTVGLGTIAFEIVANAGYELYVQYLSNMNAGTTTTYKNPVFPATGLLFLQIHDDGTTVYYNVSTDGEVWLPFYSQAHGTGITPNQAGFHVTSGGSGYAVTNRLFSWSIA